MKDYPISHLKYARLKRDRDALREILAKGKEGAAYRLLKAIVLSDYTLEGDAKMFEGIREAKVFLAATEAERNL